MHTVMLTTLGPGRNWQRLRMSANSGSLSQPRRWTMMRRAQTIGPPKPNSETSRKARNNADRVMRAGCPSNSPSARLGPLGGGEGWGAVGGSAGVGPTSPFPSHMRWVPSLSALKGGEGNSRRVDFQVPGSGKGALERRPYRALRVHRVVDRRHHAEKGMDHPGIFAVLDRNAGPPQCPGITLPL